MERSNRLEAIREGKFLSLQSETSIKSSTGCHSARERPFVVPEYDPQGSIYTSRYSKNLAAVSPSSESNYPASQTADAAVGQHEGQKPTGPCRPEFNPATPAPHYKFENAGLPSSPANPPPYTSPRPRPPRPGAMMGRRSAMRISRLSITPSMVAAGCLPPDLNYRRDSNASLITSTAPGKISPMHIVKLPGESNDHQAPPDGGTLAWLQTLAGFFVIMDAQ